MNWPIDWLFKKGPGYDWTVAQDTGHAFRLILNPTQIVPLGDGVFAQNFDGSATQQHQMGRITWGRTVRRRIEFTIRWDDDKRGEYTGHLDDDGRFRGATREVTHDPGPFHAWWNHDNNVKWQVPDPYDSSMM